MSLLEAHGIPCFVHNQGFGALFPGPQINAFNTRAIMVPEEDVPAALELVQSLQSPPTAMHSATTRAGSLRALIEFLLFGWFVPGSRRSVHEKSQHRDGQRED